MSEHLYGKSFIPQKTFEEPRVRSTYVKGLVYTVDTGNKGLAALVEGWLADGTVVLVTPGATLNGGA